MNHKLWYISYITFLNVGIRYFSETPRMTFEDAGRFLPNKLICFSFTSLWDSFLHISIFSFPPFPSVIMAPNRKPYLVSITVTALSVLIPIWIDYRIIAPWNEEIRYKIRLMCSWKDPKDGNFLSWIAFSKFLFIRGRSLSWKVVSNIKLSNFTIFRTTLTNYMLAKIHVPKI